MTLESVTACPVCASSSFQPLLTVKDYTVSQNEFQIQTCTTCGFGITSPRPDQHSIGLFYASDKYISHTGGSTSFLDQVYIFARKFTLRWKLNLINGFRQPGTLLDYGCGTGEFLKYLQANQWKVKGIEPSESARTKADKIVQNHIYHDLSANLGSFDVITLWHVLEHVHNLNEILEKLKELLKESGIMLLAVPNHLSADAKKYGTYWAGYDVPRHLWHFTQKNMEQLLSQHRLEIIKIVPMKLDAYYVSLLSESYQHPKTPSFLRMINAFLSGITSNSKATKTGEYSSLIYIARHK